MICCYEIRKGRGSCVEPSSLKNFGSMFDAEAIHAQIPSNIEPNYQRTWCNGHKTGHASVLSSYIANLPLVSPMFVLGHEVAARARHILVYWLSGTSNDIDNIVLLPLGAASECKLQIA